MKSSEIETEPILAVESRTARNLCIRCGFEFSQNHLASCNAKTENCRGCRIFNISVATHQKNCTGYPLETLKTFRKKSHNAEKIERGPFEIFQHSFSRNASEI